MKKLLCFWFMLIAYSSWANHTFDVNFWFGSMQEELRLLYKLDFNLDLTREIEEISEELKDTSPGFLLTLYTPVPPRFRSET